MLLTRFEMMPILLCLTGLARCDDPPLVVGPPVKPAEKRPDADAGQVLYGLPRATLARQSEHITKVVFSPDGTLIASAGWDKAVTLWDARTGKVKRVLTGHDGHIESLGFSRDGKRLYASDYQEVRLWDVASGEMLHTLKEEAFVTRLERAVLTPDGKTVVTINGDGDLKLWDAMTGKLRVVKRKLCETFLDVRLDCSPDSKTLATVPLKRPKVVLLLDAATGAVRKTLPAQPKDIGTLAFSPDGTLATEEKGTIKLWDVAAGKVKRSMTFEAVQRSILTFSPSGLTLAHDNDHIRFWDTATGTLRGHLYIGVLTHVHGFTFSPDGNAFALVDNEEKAVRVFDLEISREKRTLAHDRAIRTVAISPDGRTLATTNREARIEICDAVTGKVRRTLKDADEETEALAWSPDGSTLVSASREGVLFWDKEFRQHPGRFLDKAHCLAFTSDNKKLAVGNGSTVTLIDPVKRDVVKSLRGHRSDVLCVAFSPDGNRIASGSRDATVILWDTETGKPLRTLEAHEEQVGTLAFSPDGKTLATASAGYSGDTTVRVWDTARGKELLSLEGHPNRVTGVTFLGENTLLSVDSKVLMLLWDVRDGKRKTILLGDRDGIDQLALSADGKTLGTLSHKSLRLWDADDLLRKPNGDRTDLVRTPLGDDKKPPLAFASLRGQIKGHEKTALAVARSPDGTLLASGSADQTIKLWNAQTRQEVRTLSGHKNEVTSVAWSPDGKRLVSASEDRTIKVWDANTGKELRSLNGLRQEIRCVTFTPDGSTVAYGKDEILDAHLWFWDMEKEKPSKGFAVERGVASVAYSPEGKLLATGLDQDHTLLWDVATGKLRHKLDCPYQVWCVTFSPDGKWLVTSGGHMEESSLRVWDVASGKLHQDLKGHLRGLSSVVFSPDGTLLASAGGSESNFYGTMALWDVKTWTCRRMVSGRRLRDGRIPSGALTFLRDGQTLVSGRGREGEISYWNVPDLLDDNLQETAGHVLEVGGTVLRDGPLIEVKLAVNGRNTTAVLPLLKGMGKPFRLSLSTSRNLTDATLRNVAGLDQLRSLDLKKQPVSDAGLVHLTGLPNLDTLDLSGTRITNEGLEHLAKLPKLKSLDLSGTRVDVNAIEKLRKAIPGIVIRDQGALEDSP